MPATHHSAPLLAALQPFLTANASWLPLAIVVAGLFVYGIRDLLRINPGRIWAIGSVCFRDAIRRRVLWITPLAMLGIVTVSQLQKPVDEQDSIRLTVKLCFFTTGIVVTIIAIITAATNLPREIDSRVVYTIVTKPVTRLEIILGKLTGFARVTGSILLIMGLFSFVYLEARSWWLGRQISETLQSPSLDASTRNWLSHYQGTGLLVSQTVSQPRTMLQYARLPTSPNDRWIAGGIQDAIAPFSVPPESYAKAGGVAFVLRIPFEGVDPKRPPAKPPTVSLQILDTQGRGVILPAEQLLATPAITLNDSTGKTPVIAQLSAERAAQLSTISNFILQVVCSSPDYIYNFPADSVKIGLIESVTKVNEISPLVIPVLRGSAGRSGQQLQGPQHGVQPVAAFAFRGTTIATAVDGQVPFELNTVIEHTGADSESGVPTAVEARVFNKQSQKLSNPVMVYPESRRTIFFTLPAEYCGDGDFDLYIRNTTPGHALSVSESVVSLVSSRSSFAMNLLKGLFVLWLFTILTAAVALCASTFLSWPIAVVLTVLVILGNWAVSNLDLGTGLGAQIANEFFQNNSATATVVNRSVESLSRILQLIAGFLPDINSFGVTEQIERGITITFAEFLAPVKVLVLFGLPLVTAAYVFLRNKEVAP